MVSSGFAPATSWLFALSFSTTIALPPITPAEMSLWQTTSVSTAASAKGQPAGVNSTPATPASSARQGSPEAQRADLPKRPLPKKKKRSKESSAYKDWADKEVRWIITDEEREAFKLLTNDEEREKFVESFWIRRDPTPDTVENDFRDQYCSACPVCQRAFQCRYPGIDDRPRPDLHYLWATRRDRIASLWWNLRFSFQPRQGLNANISLRTLALPLYCGCRPGYRHRVRGPVHMRRLSHVDGPE